jgi:hypothetical protein
MKNRARAIGILFLLFAGILRGQQEAPVVLENADSLQGREIDGQRVRELIGHVQIRQGKVRMNCDRALHFIVAGKVFLNGNVVVHDDSVTIRAPRAVYYRDERRAEAFDDVALDDGKTLLHALYGDYMMDVHKAHFVGRVHVVDSTSVIDADTLDYMRDSSIAIATGSVAVSSRSDRMTIRGGRLYHDTNRKYSRMTVDPWLTQVDTAGKEIPDTLIVSAGVMEAFRDSTRILIARDSVALFQGSLAGRAQVATFYMDADSILLRRAPVLWYEATQVTGDSIDVHTKQRKISSIAVLGNAFAVSRSDSAFPDRFDQLTGDTILLQFGGSGLQEIDVRNQATSIYHLYDDTLANGLNKSSGDRIRMHFRGGRVAAIKLHGGVEGAYYPETMIHGKETDYRLPGFVWRTDRPTRSSRMTEHSGGGRMVPPANTRATPRKGTTGKKR